MGELCILRDRRCLKDWGIPQVPATIIPVFVYSSVIVLHALGRVQRVERHSPWSLQVRVEPDEATVLCVVRRASSLEWGGRRRLGILGPVAQMPEYGVPRLQGLALSILDEVLEGGGPHCCCQRKARLPKGSPHPCVVDVEPVLHVHGCKHLLS